MWASLSSATLLESLPQLLVLTLPAIDVNDPKKTYQALKLTLNLYVIIRIRASLTPLG